MDFSFLAEELIDMQKTEWKSWQSEFYIIRALKYCIYNMKAVSQLECLEIHTSDPCIFKVECQVIMSINDTKENLDEKLFPLDTEV